MKGCRLNRKPYTDKDGKFRMRMVCCNTPDDCKPSNDPGVLLDDIQNMKLMQKLTAGKEYGKFNAR